MTRYSESSPTDNILQPKYVPSYVKRLDLSCGELFYVFRVPKKRAFTVATAFDRKTLCTAGSDTGIAYV